MEFIRPCSVFIEVLYAEANVYSLLDTFVTILYFFSNHHPPPIPFLSIYPSRGRPEPMPAQEGLPGQAAALCRVNCCIPGPN